MWLAERRFRLVQGPGLVDCVSMDPMDRTVYINSRQCYESRLAATLHECGHVNIFLQRLRNPGRRYAGTTLCETELGEGRGSRRRRSSRVGVLEEEAAAWQYGEVLAEKLSVRYKKGFFDATRTRCLMTYVKWAAASMRKKVSKSVSKKPRRRVRH